MGRLTKNEILSLKNEISSQLPFILLDKKSGLNNEESIFEKELHRIQFEHSIDLSSKVGSDAHLLLMLHRVLEEITVEKLHRIKINITFPSSSFKKEDLIHTEELVKGCKTCIIYLTTNYGSGTQIEDGKFYESIEGDYHIFESNIPHYGIPHKDGKIRCAINIVYTEKHDVREKK